MLEGNWENIARLLELLLVLIFFVIGVVGLLFLLWELFVYLREHRRNRETSGPDYFHRPGWKVEFSEESGSFKILKKLHKSLIIVWCLAVFVMVFSILLAFLNNE